MAVTDPPSFVMHGAREAMARGLGHIKEAVEAIERAVEETPSLSFDFARSLIESVCRTVLKERSVPYDHTDDLPKLFRSVSRILPFLPPGASGAVGARGSVTKTLSGLSTAIQGICELRNQFGLASHGAESHRPVMERVQALLAAQTADTIVGFLYGVHRQEHSVPQTTSTSFDDNPTFNDLVDGAFGPLRVFEAEFRPSEVLFSMEPESYRIYLAEYDG